VVSEFSLIERAPQPTAVVRGPQSQLPRSQRSSAPRCSVHVLSRASLSHMAGVDAHAFRNFTRST
jgi:hypothetical protein